MYSNIPTNIFFSSVSPDYKNRLEQLKLRLRQNIEDEVFVDQIDIECSCCCSSKPVEDFVRCDSNHLVCVECVSTHSSNMIYTNGSFQIKCIGTTESCDCVYSDKLLEKILEKKVYKQYQIIKIRAETQYIFGIKGINLIKCQFCETCWDLDPNEKILYCMECGKKTCLVCNQSEHPDRPCDKIRIRIEEGLTRERFLVCDKCSRCIEKDEGCNAVRCPCGNNMCWGCKRSWGTTDAHGCNCGNLWNQPNQTNGLNEFAGNVRAQEYIRKLR